MKNTKISKHIYINIINMQTLMGKKWNILCGGSGPSGSLSFRIWLGEWVDCGEIIPVGKLDQIENSVCFERLCYAYFWCLWNEQNRRNYHGLEWTRLLLKNVFMNFLFDWLGRSLGNGMNSLLMLWAVFKMEDAFFSFILFFVFWVIHVYMLGALVCPF